MSEEVNFDKIFAKLERQKKARTTASEGVIRSMKKGKVRDFVKEENLDKFDKPDKEVINIMIETPDGYQINNMMSLSSHPNSNMQRYLAKYNVYPKVGGAYPLEFKSGFWRPATL